ncbi:MAG: hypothetical protein ACTIB0_12545 [Corynebacterium casei]|uniref:hypothetical protein n=1 Tax=Corynebacterium casei TaxID=160386 RepID=UPI003F9193AC
MSLSQTEHAALTQIFEAQPDLDRWRLRTQNVEQPQTDSELALDDEIFPQMAISQYVRLSLASSGEHLRLALDALRAKQLYPSSHYTVLRGALVGASQVVWILCPSDREERRERGLSAIAEMYAQMGKYYNSLDDLPEADQQRLKDQKVWLKDRRDGVAAVRKRTEALILTNVIQIAAKEAFTSPSHHEAIPRIWREMSSDAHVLCWSVFQRSSFGPTDPQTGISEVQATGSLENLAKAFLPSYRMLKHGWSLYDRRCKQLDD